MSCSICLQVLDCFTQHNVLYLRLCYCKWQDFLLFFFFFFKAECMCACSVAQWCLTLWDPMDCSLPGSSVHGNLQARTLEWVAISSFMGSSQPRANSCLLYCRQILYHWSVGEALQLNTVHLTTLSLSLSLSIVHPSICLYRASHFLHPVIQACMFSYHWASVPSPALGKHSWSSRL